MTAATEPSRDTGERARSRRRRPAPDRSACNSHQATNPPHSRPACVGRRSGRRCGRNGYLADMLAPPPSLVVTVPAACSSASARDQLADALRRVPR